MKPVKVLSLTMSIVLIIATLAACGVAGPNGSDKTSASSASAAGTSGSASSTAETEKPKVTLTMLTNNIIAATNGVQTDPVSKEIEKQTGVTLDLTYMTSQDAYKTKIAAMTASGDLPDIVEISGSDKATRNLIYNAGSAKDLTDLLKTNGKNYINNPTLNFAIEFHKKFSSKDGDGKLYVIPTACGAQSGVGDPVVGCYVRWDYYKELGYPTINNPDELLNVLENIQKKHPLTAAGKKAYATNFFIDWGLECPLEDTMFDGFSSSGPLCVDISNDSVTPIYTNKDGAFWKWVKFYNNARQRGLLDPDSTTMKYDQYVAKIKAGQVYSFSQGWQPVVFEGEKGQGYVAVDYNPGSDKINANYGHAVGANLFVITNNCKNPDRAMDLFNYVASDAGARTLNSGVEGNAWDNVNGKPTYKKEVIALKTNPQEKFREEYGVEKYRHLAAFAWSMNSALDNVAYDLAQTPEYAAENLTEAQKDAVAHYNVKTTGEVFLKRKVNGYLLAVPDAMPTPPDEIKAIDDKANAYIGTNWLKAVISKDNAEFTTNQDAFIKDLMDMGYQKVLDWYTETWNTTKATVDSLVK